MADALLGDDDARLQELYRTRGELRVPPVIETFAGAAGRTLTRLF